MLCSLWSRWLKQPRSARCFRPWRGLGQRNLQATVCRSIPREVSSTAEWLEVRALLSSAGDLDTAFDSDGKLLTDIGGTQDVASDVAIQADGKIVVVGTGGGSGPSNTDFVLARYLSDGSLDTTFNGNGKVDTGFVNANNEVGRALVIQNDGKLVVAGSTDSLIAVLRYNANGSLDTSFSDDGINVSFSGIATDVALQSDGKIIAAGVNGNSFVVVRYLSDGTLDTSFDSDGRAEVAMGSIVEAVVGVAIQADGKIVVAGNSNEDFAVIRLNSDGSLDTSFDNDGIAIVSNGGTERARSVLIQPDGKIVVTGSATVGGSGVDFAAVRFQTDGSLDTGFNSVGIATTAISSLNDESYAVALQPNGQIVAVGYAFDATRIGVVRYNANGSLDASFNNDGIQTTEFIAGDHRAFGVAIQPDGKIVVVGSNFADFAVARYLGDQSDYGDAPAPYPTTLSVNGARHVANGPTLGSQRDSEADGQPNATATGDDAAGTPDDEDGVTFFSSLLASPLSSTTAVLNANLQNAVSAKLDAWMDFNQDGDWGDDEEQIFVDRTITNGSNAITFAIPAGALPGTTFARFRVSTSGGLAPTGLANDGEVEDYRVTILPFPTAGSPRLFGTDNFANGQIHVYDTATRTQTASFANAISLGIHEIAFDPVGRLLFATEERTSGNIDIYDTVAQVLVGSFPTGLGFAAQELAFDPLGRLLYATDNRGLGDITIFDTVTQSQVGTLLTSSLFGSIDIAYDPVGQFLYSAQNRTNGDIDIFDTVTRTRVGGFATGSGSGIGELAYDPVGHLLYGSESRTNANINVYDTLTQTLVGSIASGIGSSIQELAYDSAAHLLYASDSLSNGSVFVYNTVTRALIASFSTGFSGSLPGLEIVGSSASFDFGDAPDTGSGTGSGNYNTLFADNGPSHTIVAGLFIGAHVDGDIGVLQNTTSNADDVNGALPDDEDGLNSPLADLTLTIGAAPTVNVIVTNTTGSAATLYGWIDYNANGVFDNAAERASVTVPSGSSNVLTTLTFPVVPGGFIGTTYARFRLSTDAAAANSTGAASNGEVEDYVATITKPGDGTVASTLKIANDLNGGPMLANDDRFATVAALGDLDGDGVVDLAVGAQKDDTSGNDTGAVYVLFMNSNGTVKSRTKIANNTNGGPALSNYDFFGKSVAALGDLDGDGVTDLAVGANTGGNDQGKVYVLFLNTNGTVKSSTVIASGVGGGPTLANADNFGASVSSLGDLDGDGVTDLAVGAYRDDTGGTNRGAVYVLFMNSNGTAKSFTKIASSLNGGPSLSNEDHFFAVAALGDLDGDGVTELAVGASDDDTVGTDRGAVYVLRLNTDGTVKGFRKITSGINGGPALNTGDQFGRSVASLGDLDGDGVTDLVVGAIDNNIGGTRQRGEVFVLLMNADGTARSSIKIASETNGGPSLDQFVGFGDGVTALGDLNGDGVTDLAVGVQGDDTGGEQRGAVYVLFVNPFNDFGDAPAPYPTTTAANGARHAAIGPTLGSIRDRNNDGTASASADADDAITPGMIYFVARNDGTIKRAALDGSNATVVVSGLDNPRDVEVDVANEKIYWSSGDGSVDRIWRANLDGSGIESVVGTGPHDSLRQIFLDAANGVIYFGNRFDSGTLYRVNTDGSGLQTLFTGSGNYWDIAVDAAAGKVYWTDVTGNTVSRANLDGSNRQNLFTNSSSAGMALDLASGSLFVGRNGDIVRANLDGSSPTVILPGFEAADIALNSSEGKLYYSTDLSNLARSNLDGSQLQTFASGVSGLEGIGVVPIVPDDEDGVTFGTIRVGQLGTTVTVTVANAPDGAKLDAWIDFNGDGSWGGADEQIAESLAVVNGNNTITFNVPSGADDGTTYARFRLSTTGNLGPKGAAADGEIEDYLVTIASPIPASGEFAEQFTILASARQTVSVIAADVDGDGDLDVLSASVNNGEIAWYENDGTPFNAGWEVHSITTVADQARRVFVADLDGDGDLDVLSAASQVNSQIVWYENDGTPDTGPWTARTISTTAGQFGSVVVGDVDGDGDFDAVSAGYSANSIFWYENDGSPLNGGWTERVIATGIDGAWMAVVADVDGDGDLDAVSASWNDDTVAWFENDGTPANGGWTTRVITTGADRAFSVAVADLDGDGDQDVVSTSTNDDEVAWFENDGSPSNGGWTTRIIATERDSPTSVVAADIDGDGAVDLAVSSYGDGTISWIRNDGTPSDGGWSLRTISTAAAGATSVFVADMDGDGDGDVLSSSVTDDKVAIYEHLDSDYGDAPDAAAGTGTGNYQSRSADNGPSHRFGANLRLGASVDYDSGALQNAAANADDANGEQSDDEDGLSNPLADLTLTIGSQPTVNVFVTNTTGSAATLYGWIDYNANGVFDNVTERTSVTVPNGMNGGIVTLTFPAVPAGFTGTTYARFRLSTDSAAANPTGSALNGEVEDYAATITKPSDGTVSSSVKIAHQLGSTLSLADTDFFGYAIESIGDLDNDGVIDLAVGVPHDDTGGNNQGAVYLLFMKVDGSVKSFTKIASGTSGVPTFQNDKQFGSSVAAIGDLDGDGVTELAVGVIDNPGVVCVLFLRTDGTVKNSTTIGSLTNGGPSLLTGDAFGSAVASLGDLDGDGVPDLAVGASGDDIGGSYSGAMYVLLMKSDGTAKTSVKIAAGTPNAPPLTGNIGFGDSIAALGDLNGDGVTEIAVAAPGDDTGGHDRGAVYVLFLNRDGSLQSGSQKIASGEGGAPTIDDEDQFGTSLESLGDLNGDGVADLAVGAIEQDGNGGGSVHVLFLNSDGTVNSSKKIASGIGGGPTLANGDYFGKAIASLGDLNGDGVIDLAVGSQLADEGGTDRGSVHVLFLNPVNRAPAITSSATASVAENTTSVLTVTATDADLPAQTLSFSIVGGADQSKFDITSGGVLTFQSAPDFENPTDAGTDPPNPDNLYEVTVQVSDGNGGAATQSITITVTDVNDVTPVVTTNQSFSVAENSAATTAVGTVLATDGDMTATTFQSWTITAGNTDKDGDSTLPFAINASTGEITVNDAGDLDREQTTSFTLSVTVSDGVNTSAAQTVTINLTDVNDVTPVVTANQSFSVAENSAATTAVGTVLATDGDVTATTFQSWTITAGNTDKDGDSTLPFAINASTGAITVNDAGDLDREQTASFTLSVTVSDGVNTSAAQTLTINLTDVNDVTPVVTANQSFNVAENSAATTAVGTVLATDGDVTATTFQSWTITAGNTDKDGDSTLPFAINASTGEITVNDTGDLDREQTASFTLSVTVSDGVNTSSAQTVTVNLTDVNDVTPVVTANQSFSVAENSAATTAVGTVLATDGDVTATTFQSWTITAGNTDKDGDSTLPFAINASTGAITVNDAGDLDREQTASFTLSVTVSDGVHTSAAQTVTVNLTDANDVTPVVTANQSFNVAENSAATTAVGTVLATDGDVTATTFQSWTITAGNTDKDGDSTLPFAINTSTGAITVNDTGDLDREQTSTFTLSVTVSDGVNMSSAQTVTINLTDVNDVTPVITANQSFNVAENSAATAAVGTVLATDGDVTATTFQSWTITAGNTDKDGDSTLPFAINASTGAITVNDAGDLDREQTSSFTLSVTVSDGVHTSAAQTVTVNLTDVNDVTPVVTANQSFNVAENSAATTAVGTVLATDGDVTATTFQSWTLTAGNTDKDGDSTLPFAINASTGAITVNDAGDLDREQTSSFTLSVTVSDGVNTSAAQTMTINLTDVNDVTPIVTANQSFSVVENSAATTAVGTVLATDGDVTATMFQSWMITAGNSDKDGDSALPFAINTSTGLITVNDSGDLDREQTSSFTLSVTVSDGFNTSAAQTVAVNLTDVNDVTPVVTAAQSFSVAENSAATTAVGTAVGTVLATDGDVTVTTFQSWTITAGNTDKDGDSTLPFAINASTGAIAVNDVGDLDREQTSSFTLSVTVSDGVNTSAAQTVTVNLTDVNDVTPVVTAAQSFSVAENSAAMTAVGTVLATDGDVTATTFQNWTITAGNTDKDADSTLPFAINASTGAITVNDAGDLDREQTTSFTLSVTVSDGVNTSSAQTVDINVADENDVTPVVTANQSFNVAENSAATTAVETVLATDGDATATTFQNWTITAGNTDKDGDSTLPFAINASTGAITVNDAGDLDREQTASFTLSVTVTDGVNTSAAQTVTVNLTDVNDVTPVVTANQSFNVAENSAATTAVGMVLATDGDVTATTFQNWMITAGNTDKDGDSTLPFAINASTGAITVNDAGDLDREQTSSVMLSVTVSDEVHTSSAQTVTINLTDVNDVTPVVTADQSFSVAENSAATTAVGTLLATDGDVTATTFQSWTITAGNMDKDGDSTLPFAINASTGAITVNDAGDLDREQTASFTLSVTVSDGVNTSAAQTVTINLTDVNDLTPIVTANQSFSVVENSAATTAVGTVLATDGDVTATTFQDWTITAGNTDKDGDSSLPFAFNASTGAITVNDAGDLDREQTTSFTLSVTVSDGVNTSGVQTVTVNLTDVNDVTPVVTAGQSFNVAENSSATTAVGTVLTTDGDVTATTFQNWMITAGNTDKDGDSTLPFAINASTGAITVNDAGDLDREQTASFTLSVTASDGVNTSAAQTVTINLTDVNDVTPVVTAAQSFNVVENSAATTAVGTELATDGDVTATTFQNWTITAGNTDKDGDSTLPFAINASTGAITVNDAGDLDREQTISFTLSVAVSDGVNTSEVQTVTINLTDVNDVTPIVTANQNFGVAENSAATTAVGTVLATDGDVTATTFQSWTITAGNTDKDGDSTLPFSINASTGAITVNDAGDLDREQTVSFTLSVTVSDGIHTSAAQTLTITLTDEKDVTPVVTADQIFSVAENSAATTAVGTVLATDGDVTATTFQSWTITAGNTDKDGDSTLPFAISASTGAITVNDAGDLDREQTASFTLSVTVSDGLNTSAAQTVTVNLTDVNDVTPIVTANQSFNLAENSAAATGVGTVLATDGDVTATTFQSWAITAGNTDKDGDSTLPFAISASTGAITVNDAGDLDRELTASFTLSVTVSDGVNTSSAPMVTVNLADVNEFNPTVSGGPFSISENSANGTAVGTVSGSDNDATNGGLSYAITGGNSLGIFTINSSSGTITVLDPTNLDREALSSVSLTVQVSDTGPGTARTGSTDVTINLIDMNEFDPVLNDASFSVAENSANGSSVGTLTATDADASRTLSYSIVAGNVLGIFTINSSTGTIKIANNANLDREAVASVTLTVQVSDSGPGEARTDTAAVTINVTDVNEFDPVLSEATFSIAENSPNGTPVGTASASDSDATKSFSFSITAGNGLGLFAIDSATGEITVANSANLDRESVVSVTLTVQLSDGGPGAAHTDSTAVIINVTDVNEFDPVLNDASFSIAENLADGSSVGSVTGTDADATKTISYSITAGNSLGIFAINSATGAITIADNTNLDRESFASVTLTVQVSDGGPGTARTDTAAVTIGVTDLNEFDPVLDDATFSIAENSANNTSVGTVTASDSDATRNFSYSITAGNSLGIFAIDSVTGAIRVADKTSLNRETLSSVSLTVQVSDGGPGTARTDTATMIIDVTEVNDAPTGVNDLRTSVLEDSSVIVMSFADLLVNDIRGPSSESGQTLTITEVSNPLGGTVTIRGTNVEFTPAHDFNGMARFTYTLQDDGTTNGVSDFQTSTANVSFPVSAINDVPSFSAGANVTRLGDGAQKTVLGWATNISQGATDEADQTMNFVMTTNNTAMFATNGLPTIDPNTGNLTFTPRAGAPGTGTATVTVRLHDNGGGTGPNVDLSAAQTFTITMTGLNRAPSFTKGPNQPAPNQPLALEDSGLHSVTNWATAISPGTGENAIGQVLNFVLTNNNNSLFTAQGQPAISADGTLTYTLADNASGLATVTVILHDDGLRLGGAAARDSSAAQTFRITVTPVNDAPSFTKGNDQTVLEDAVAQSVTNWATSINKGAANESTQVLTFVVTNNNNSLFATQPAITAAGKLTYKPAANANGSALVTVRLQDNGGLANGGSNASADQTFTINVTAVNDAPTITVPRAQTTNEDINKLIPAIVVADLDATMLDVTLAVAHGWITLGTVTGLTFQNGTTNGSATVEVQGSKADLNAALASINFLPDQDFNGSDTLTATVSDLGATGTGAVLMASKTVAITIKSVNDAPKFTKGDDQTVNDDDGVQSIANWATLLDPGAANESSQTLKFTVTTDNKALFATQPAISPNGTLTFKPNLEVAGIATVTVKLSDNGGKANGGIDTSAAQTFTITVTDQSVDLTATLQDGGDTVTVLRDGNNLVVRRGTTDLVPPTRMEDVGLLTINGGSGGDRVTLDASLNTAGPARFRFHGNIQFNGNAGDDVFDASKYTGTVAKVGVQFEGGDGIDSVLGSGGKDTLAGGNGNDTLKGLGGDDAITGGNDNDALLGGDGDDQLDGGDHSDTVIGGSGKDTLHGGDGDDTVIGGLGVDAVFGDAGNDLGLGGRGGSPRGNGQKDAGDVLDASLESINEAFATLFAFEI